MIDHGMHTGMGSNNSGAFSKYDYGTEQLTQDPQSCLSLESDSNSSLLNEGSKPSSSDPQTLVSPGNHTVHSGNITAGGGGSHFHSSRHCYMILEIPKMLVYYQMTRTSSAQPGICCRLGIRNHDAHHIVLIFACRRLDLHVGQTLLEVRGCHTMFHHSSSVCVLLLIEPTRRLYIDCRPFQSTVLGLYCPISRVRDKKSE